MDISSVIHLVLDSENLIVHEKEIDHPIESRVDNLRVHIKHYREDFIYRLIFETRKMKFFCEEVHLGRIPMDAGLHPETRRNQVAFFQECREKLELSMTTPEGYERPIPKEKVTSLSQSLDMGLYASQDLLHFIYTTLNILHGCHSLMNFVQKHLIPREKASTLANLLDDAFLSEKSLGVQGCIMPETKFNVMASFNNTFRDSYFATLDHVMFRVEGRFEKRRIHPFYANHVSLKTK